MQKLTKTFKYGDQEVTLETGQIARQASGAVMVSMGDTRVMVTVVGRKEADPIEGGSGSGGSRRNR